MTTAEVLAACRESGIAQIADGAALRFRGPRPDRRRGRTAVPGSQTSPDAGTASGLSPAEGRVTGPAGRRAGVCTALPGLQVLPRRRRPLLEVLQPGLRNLWPA